MRKASSTARRSPTLFPMSSGRDKPASDRRTRTRLGSDPLAEIPLEPVARSFLQRLDARKTDRLPPRTQQESLHLAHVLDALTTEIRTGILDLDEALRDLQIQVEEQRTSEDRKATVPRGRTRKQRKP